MPKHENSPRYILNPVSGRYVLKTGAIGRKLMSQKSVELKDCVDTTDMVRLGYGAEGVVFDLGNGRVVKIIKKYNKKRFPNEIKLSKEMGKAGLGPKIYESGFCKYRGKKVGFIVLEKLKKPKKRCTPKQIKGLYYIFEKMSNLGIALGDSNINNIMVKGRKWKIIDMGKGKKMKKKDAFESNMTMLAMMARTISGKGVQGGAKLGFRCKNIDPLITLLYENGTDKILDKLHHFRESYNISNTLKKNITLEHKVTRLFKR